MKKRKNFRLPNGAGSVYKLSGNRRNPFTAVIHCGYTEEGKPIRKYLGYYPTYEDALHGLEMYKETPYNLNERNSTLSDLFRIFEKRKKKNVSKATFTLYKSAFGHLSPIADNPIRTLRTHDLQAVLDSLDLKPQSKNMIRTLLNQLYELACEMDIVNKNYAKYIDIGKYEKSSKHKPFTELEIRKLWNSIDKYPFAELALILCYTGMRPSELINIKKEDCHINEGYFIGGMKTAAGRDRIIPIHPAIKKIVERRYCVCEEFLCEHKNKPYIYNTFYEYWRQLMIDLELEHLPHDGRHTFITYAKKANMDSLLLKRIVGHADKDLTEKVYTHTDIDQLIQAVSAM